MLERLGREAANFIQSNAKSRRVAGAKYWTLPRMGPHVRLRRDGGLRVTWRKGGRTSSQSGATRERPMRVTSLGPAVDVQYVQELDLVWDGDELHRREMDVEYGVQLTPLAEPIVARVRLIADQ